MAGLKRRAKHNSHWSTSVCFVLIGHHWGTLTTTDSCYDPIKEVHQKRSNINNHVKLQFKEEEVLKWTATQTKGKPSKTNKLMGWAASRTSPPGLFELGTASLVSSWNGGRKRQSLVPYPSDWLSIITQAIFTWKGRRPIISHGCTSWHAEGKHVTLTNYLAGSLSL